MMEDRPHASWLQRLAGLFALAGILALSACGGGSGAPNNPFAPPPPTTPALAVTPSAATVFSQVATTLTISGGFPPYSAFSSNSAILPLNQVVPGNTVTLLASDVGASTLVNVTIRDSSGQQVQAAVTVLPGPPSPPPALVVLPSPVDVFSAQPSRSR